MGIIAWQSDESTKVRKTISKVKVHASQFLIANGNLGEFILQYRPRAQPPSYVDVDISLTPKIRTPVDINFKHLDMLPVVHIKPLMICCYPPNWQSIMSKVLNSNSKILKCTTVR